MKVHKLAYRQVIPVPLARVFEFFSEAQNLELITPPEVGFKIFTKLPIEMKAGTLIDYQIKINGIPMRWRTLISAYEPPHSFTDQQIKGPYKQWIHTHTFSEDAEGNTIMEDEVLFALPFSPFGEIALPLIRPKLERIFSYRAEVVLKRLQA